MSPGLFLPGPRQERFRIAPPIVHRQPRLYVSGRASAVRGVNLDAALMPPRAAGSPAQRSCGWPSVAATAGMIAWSQAGTPVILPVPGSMQAWSVVPVATVSRASFTIS